MMRILRTGSGNYSDFCIFLGSKSPQEVALMAQVLNFGDLEGFQRLGGFRTSGAWRLPMVE